MKLLCRLLFLTCLMCLAVLSAAAQDSYISPPESLLLDGVPKIPVALAKATKRHASFRGSNFSDWRPTSEEMLISTRSAETHQLHLISTPGGEPKQLTSFPDSVSNGRFHPNGGDYIVFKKDVGGGEWYQLFRYDMKTGDSTMLTDGKSRNLLGPWSSDGNLIAYTSTRRTGEDTDLWEMNPADPKTDHMVTQLSGGGWRPEDWSPDDKKILLREEISVNESYLWLVNAATGQKSELTPHNAKEKVSYVEARFSKDGKGIYVTTDKDSEFYRLAYIDLVTKQPTYLTTSIHWDAEDFELTHDGKLLAFVTNVEGLSVLDVRNLGNGKGIPLPQIPPGVISGLRWHRNGHELGFSLTTSSEPGDCYSLDIATGKLERWTASEAAENTDSSLQAVLIHWKSFDGRAISGFLYRPPAKFTGKRPVLVEVHGGPEEQSQPTFLGREDYYFLNGLGIALIYPNVRGSTGFGKTFSLLDNGFNREDSYKDINALFDWIATQPELDSDRVAVTGASYGGHMTLAVSTFYSDRIRCSVDIVGASNLVTFLEHTEAYRRDLRRVEYGDERNPKMRAFLEKIAPMNNIEKIKKPMMVIAGKNDPRVPVSESQQIADALKKQGTPVWLMIANDEGHGYRKKHNRDFQFYATVAFLQQYLLK